MPTPTIAFEAAREADAFAGPLPRNRLGANGYVVKPVEFERFKDAARWLCDYWLGLNELPQES